MARAALRGVGDAALGEWRELGDTAVHLRRRLTAKEMDVAGITGVRDIRDTPEEAQRMKVLFEEAPRLRAAFSALVGK